MWFEIADQLKIRIIEMATEISMRHDRAEMADPKLERNYQYLLAISKTLEKKLLQ